MQQPRLWPVALSFATFGAFWGSWAVVVADVERDLGLSHGGFGLLLAFALCGGALANAVAGSLAERWGTARMLTGSLFVWAALLVVGTQANGVLVFAPVIAAAFASGGAVDVVMNIAATAGLAGEPGKLIRFHAFFNAGAGLGAGLAGLAIHDGLSWRWVWVGVAAVGVVVGVICARVPLPAGHAGEEASLLHAITSIKRERLVLLAIVFACGALVEGGIDTWGVLFLRDELGAAVAVGASAAALGYLVAAAGRTFLGPVAGGLGAARGIGLGLGLTTAGLLLVSVTNAVWIAAVGLVAAAGGVSVSWPLLLSHASEGKDRPAAVVGGISAVGYLGLVIGPPLVGSIAGVADLRWGMGFLAVVALFVAIAPSRFAAGNTPS